ncbi:MAG: ABC transporter ATP-binding protein [Methanoregulaceae archaeon]|jgi:ABC-type Fe3+/spermidine/putrescine transport system ATPase subunit|nr:ABC transporter ATP-binding protein [Methanoregulaceae archaeon]
MMIGVDSVSLKRGTFSLMGVSLEVPEKSYTVLMGPSGAGKTLLLETIGGFHTISEGKITIDGQDVSLYPPEMRGIGFVYQDYSLFPHLTVEENISFGLKMKRVPSAERKETVHTLLSSFSLLPLSERYTGSLSGGEKQRVALARALATRPSALLLDEPFSALDPDTRSSCMDEVKALQREYGLTILQVSHDREEAYRLADQVVVMDRGVVLQSGLPATVFSRPGHRTVASIAGYENVLEGTTGPADGEGTPFIVGGVAIIVHGSFPVYTSCLACIRANDISLSRTDIPRNGSLNIIEGQVVSLIATDQGTRLRFDGPFPLIIEIPRHIWPDRGYQPGEKVRVSIAPEDVHLIPLAGEHVNGVVRS